MTYTMKEWLWFIALLPALLFPSISRAEEQSADLTAVAHALLPEIAVLLRRPVPVPQIGWVSDREIFEHCQCHARAVFMEGVVGVSLSVDATSKEGQAVIVHELVHWVQFFERGNADGCEQWLARESEALMIERLWRVNHSARLPPPPQYRCLVKQ